MIIGTRNVQCSFESLEQRICMAASGAAEHLLANTAPIAALSMSALANSSVAGTVWTADGSISVIADGNEVLGGDGPASMTFKSNSEVSTDMGTFLRWQQSGSTITFTLDPAGLENELGAGSVGGISYNKQMATVTGNTMKGSLDCTFVVSAGPVDLPAQIKWSFTAKLKSAPPDPIVSEFSENWEAAKSGVSVPGADVTIVQSGAHAWLLQDTASEDGPSPNKASILKWKGSKALRLDTVDAQSGSANNEWVELVDAGPYNNGFGVALNSSSQLRFKAAGYLADPQVGSPNNLFRPYGDTVALKLRTRDGDEVAYILNRNAKRTPDTKTPHYKEVFLDPAQGVYLRNVYKDFSAIPGFTKDSPIVSIAYEVSDVGNATLDDLYIGSKAPNEAPTAALAKLRQPSRDAKSYYFKVTYADENGIDAGSVGNDIAITGPNHFKQTATLTEKTPAGNAGVLVATYRLRAPGGTWNASDNGTYTFALGANQVSDTAGKSAAAKTLGTLKVSISATASGIGDHKAATPAGKEANGQLSRLVREIVELL